MKALGQAGLDFIAGKYKELKGLVSKKADKSEIKTKLSELLDDNTHRTVTDDEKTHWNNKVSQRRGKGLSTNDYDNTAKSKVDAIPANPKYTDTTYDLSKYAEKSDISRCKTKGYNASNTWKSVSTERDLEDWIGDFDKRTRELRGGGAEFKVLTTYNRYIQKTANEWMLLKIGNYVIASYMGNQGMSDFTYNVDIPVGFRPKSDIFVSYTTPDKRGGAVSTGFTLHTNGSVSAPGASNDWFVGNFTLIYECA